MSALTKDDLNSPTWLRLKVHLETELLALREKNDADATEVETARTRGEIRRVKSTLALADKPAPKVVAERFE